MTKIIIETERLLLRPPILNDLPAFTKMRGDFERSAQAGGGLDAAGAWVKFMSWVGAWQCYGFGMFSVIEKSSNEWIGNIGPVNMFSWHGQEFGWALIESADGKGFAQEAAIAALDWCFKNLEFDEFVHSISPDNIASANLAKRIGAKFIGEMILPAPYEGKIDHLWKSYRN
jgi:RimJ/RimL family protein N-acetyltransferase